MVVVAEGLNNTEQMRNEARVIYKARKTTGEAVKQCQVLLKQGFCVV